MYDPTFDYYGELGVLETATYATLHRAYRAHARSAHPDVVGDESAMKRLNEAWDVLRDPERRAAYDRERTAALTGHEVDVSTAVPVRAGPPPGRGFGPVLTFGRYEGWSIGEVAQQDPEFLRWLRTTPLGRSHRRAIDAVFAELEARPRTLAGRRPAFGGF